MRIAKVSNFYDEYVTKFYASRPKLEDESYQNQLSALFGDSFGWGNSWSVALGKIGYDAVEIIGNVVPLKRAWIRENSAPCDESLESYALERLIRFDPEILFLSDYSSFPLEWLLQVREKCRSLRFVIGWCGAPYSNPAIFKGMDLVLSNIPELVSHFRESGHTCEHMNHAFEPTILSKIGNRPERRFGFSFVGQIVKSKNFHGDREKLLVQVAKKVPIDIFSSAASVGQIEDMKSILKMGLFEIGNQFAALGLKRDLMGKFPALGKHLTADHRPARAKTPELERHLHSPVFGLEMYRTLRDSVVTLNQHIDVSKNSASNMRLFEATGVGGCLLTDWKANLKDIFAPDTEVVTYRSAEECAEKAQWLCANPAKAEQIGQAAQARVLREHTFDHRAPIFDRFVRQRL